jgi:hypothetical protein
VAGGSVSFQAQNPAKSGDRSTYRNAKGHTVFTGWSNCTAFVAAMGAEFDSGVRLTGTQVRRESSEPRPDPASPGLNLSQVRAVLKAHGVRMDVQTPIDFDDLDELREAGHAIALQIDYTPFLGTKFAGSKTFKDGHIVLWLPNGDVYDPLHDGRARGIAKAPVRVPRDVLREAAGTLETNAASHRKVGLGRAYAGIFHTRHPVSRPAQVTRTFGAVKPPAIDFAVVVPTALVRTAPGGVPGKGNVVGRRRRGERVAVFGTTSRGQRVAGSRVWHQVDRAGTRFMHSSVIDPVR